MSQTEDSLEGIAVIGLSGRFPGAGSVDEFWRNLRDGVESIHRFTDQELEALGITPEVYNHPNYVKAGTVLESAHMFDAGFFGFHPREAETREPQHRVFLECTWEALENAGYDVESYEGQIGVFAGCSPNYYGRIIPFDSDPALVAEAYQREIANEKDYLCTLVAYKLGLRGPAMTIQAACSTSLVAVCMACQNLMTYQCDLALAGGVCVNTRQKGGYFYQEGLIPSPDGHCRAFDAKARGTVLSQGAGVVVLKRLSDALDDGDKVYAVIKGFAVNNDGSEKVGFTAPGVNGQAEVVAMALALSGFSPETISYIEAHGTGTSLGDPIEMAALNKVFREYTDKTAFCAIGSLKTNIGHMDAAAGVAGLIKTVLMLKNKEIPPSLHFENPNPEIDFDKSPFYVNTELREWVTDGVPLRAGVSAFGLGGTNAHVVLEEAPETEPSAPSRPRHLLIISARTKAALDAATANLQEHLSQNPAANIADVAYTLQTGRKVFNHRRFVVCEHAKDAAEGLKSFDPTRVKTRLVESRSPEVAFMFPGQGTQYVNMGSNLYEHEREFRETVDRCTDILQPYLGLDLRRVIYPKDGDLEKAAESLRKTAFQQPAIFTIEYALAKLWERWGVRPSAMIGHSIGQYVAACLAEVFSLEDALMLVAIRGRMMQELPGGAMLSVRLPAEQVEPKLDGRLTLAAVNAPALCVVSGPTDAVKVLQTVLESEGVMCRFLHTSHAFHSPMMDSIVEPFAEKARYIRFSAPRIPFVSTVSGTWITLAEAKDPMYWGKHLRHTVRFADGIKTLWERPERVLLEVGPRATSTTLARQQAKDLKKQIAIPSLGDTADNQGELSAILNAAGQLWLAGFDIDWPAFYETEKRHRVALPTYPFERKRFWIEPRSDRQQTTTLSKVSDNAGYNGHVEIESPILEDLVASHVPIADDHDGPGTDSEILLAKVWQEVLGVERITLNDNYFADLGGDSLSVLRVIEIVRKKTGLRLDPNLFLVNTLRQIAAHIGHQNSRTGRGRQVTAAKLQAISSIPAERERKEISALYFGESEEKLFGIYQAPRAGLARAEGVLLCYPIGQEYMVSHWAFRRLSNLLSRAGFHVFRFDYFGTGDSAGQSGEGGVSRWKADICSAAQELRKISGVKKVSAVGLRLGAALAAEACAGGLYLKNLVLWDLVVSGKKYMDELAKMHKRYYSFLKQQKTESAPDELLGFPFPNDMRASIEEVDLFLLPQLRAERIALVVTEEREEYSAFGRQLISAGVQFHHEVFPKGDDSKNGSRRWEGEILEDGLLPIKIEILSTVAAAIVERESK
jgi:acyl transferase domain-containing protein